MGSEYARFLKAQNGAFFLAWQVPKASYLWREGLTPTKDGFPDDQALPTGPWLVDPQPFGCKIACKSYLPGEVRSLHRTFARIAPTQPGILAFANKYGALGRERSLLYDAAATGSGQELLAGEPLSLWLGEVARLKRLLEIWDLTKDADAAGKVGQHIRWDTKPLRVLLVWGDEKQGDGHIIAVGGEPGLEKGLLRRWKFGKDVIEPARFYVHTEVNEAMRGHVSPAILPLVKGQLALFPHDLLAAIYVHFALEMSGRTRPARICGYCNMFFTPSRSDQRFCSSSCRSMQWQKEHPKATGRGTGGE